MATCSSILAWKIPQTEEPGGLHTVHRVPKSNEHTYTSHKIRILYIHYTPTGRRRRRKWRRKQSKRGRSGRRRGKGEGDGREQRSTEKGAGMGKWGDRTGGKEGKQKPDSVRRGQ